MTHIACANCNALIPIGDKSLLCSKCIKNKLIMVPVHLLAFANRGIRHVTLPGTWPGRFSSILDAIFYYGQNDYAFGKEKNLFPSISAGDVINYKNKYFLIVSMDFKEMTETQFELYKMIPQSHRCKVYLAS